jgi:ribosomal subunit interface protein
MQVPVRIDFQNMDQSEAVIARIRERIGRLERHFDRMTGCNVTVQAPHHHHHKGNTYQVRIVMHVPGGELAVSRDPGTQPAHADVFVAVRDAFDAAERRLIQHVARQRGEVKTHETPLQGRVARLFPDDGYGFVAATDGREIYFHRNSVIDDGFDALTVGQAVQLAVAEDESDAGPQATTVRPIGSLRLQPTAV